jgi:ribonuclease J
VIFSSRTIPGNEKAVGRVINGLIDQGIEVITDRTHLVHVSGHPRRAELEEMLRWVRPRIVVPVHGEALHLAEHAALARRVGVPQVLPCANGDLLRLGPDTAGLIDEVPSGRLYKDGALVVDAGARTVPDRRRLGFAGIVSVAVAVSDRGELVADPEVQLTGVPEKDAEGREFSALVYDAVLSAFESMPRARRRDPDSVEEAMSRAARAAVGQAWQKRPICHVHVLVV